MSRTNNKSYILEKFCILKLKLRKKRFTAVFYNFMNTLHMDGEYIESRDLYIGSMYQWMIWIRSPGRVIFLLG